MQDRAKASRTAHSKKNVKMYRRNICRGERRGEGGKYSLHISLCLHNSVSCIGILSLSDCNESPV